MISVSIAPAAGLGYLDKLLDLGRQQVLATTHIGIGDPNRGNLPVFVTWLN
jgi:hypothetical protein